MKTVSATDAKQRFAAVIDMAQREPVLIQRQNRDVAVVLSREEFDRMRGYLMADFNRFCDEVGRKAVERGLTEKKLAELLEEE